MKEVIEIFILLFSDFEPLSLYKHPDYAIMLCRNAETISSLNRTKGPTNIVEYYRDRDDEIMNFDPAEQYEFLEEITRFVSKSFIRNIFF